MSSQKVKFQATGAQTCHVYPVLCPTWVLRSVGALKWFYRETDGEKRFERHLPFHPPLFDGGNIVYWLKFIEPKRVGSVFECLNRVKSFWKIWKAVLPRLWTIFEDLRMTIGTPTAKTAVPVQSVRSAERCNPEGRCQMSEMVLENCFN